jgi:hypothetical protein
MSATGGDLLRTCRQCYGTGDCFQCSGRGSFSADLGGSSACHSCGGSGRCILCSGRGEVAHPTDKVLPRPRLVTLAR